VSEEGVEQFQTVEDLARAFHTTVHAIYAMRHRGQGPKAIKVGRKLLFRDSDIEAWLREREEAGRA